MIPFEALMPWGIIFGLITVGGGGLSVIHSVRNNGKRDRTRLDAWDKQLMERDMRLTGKFREQSDKPIADDAFKTSSLWKLQKSY